MTERSWQEGALILKEPPICKAGRAFKAGRTSPAPYAPTSEVTSKKCNRAGHLNHNPTTNCSYVGIINKRTIDLTVRSVKGVIMKTLKHLALAAALFLPLAAIPAQAGVGVTFVDAKKFTDANPHSYYKGGKDQDRALGALRTHIEEQAGKYLRPGQDLQIEVLGVDLAGRIDWWSGWYQDVRVLRDIDSPAIKVRYTLTENGRTLASGEERIIDMGYLRRINVWHGSERSLRYEKAMLSQWLRDRISKAN